MKKRNFIPIILPVLLLLVYSIYATNQLHTPDFSVISGGPAVSEPGFTADPETQKLHLQYEPGDGAPTNIVKSDTLNGYYEGNLFFVALQNVTIQLNGKYVPLETAIREGDISGFDRAGHTSQIAGRCGHRPLRVETKNPAGPIGVSRVKYTHYTARKNFTRNRVEIA